MGYNINLKAVQTFSHHFRVKVVCSSLWDISLFDENRKEEKGNSTQNENLFVTPNLQRSLLATLCPGKLPAKADPCLLLLILQLMEKRVDAAIQNFGASVTLFFLQLLLIAFPKQSVICHTENLYSELSNKESRVFPNFPFDHVNVTCGFMVKK